MKKFENFVLPVIILCLLLAFTSCKKKEGCTDKTATNYDASAENNCCCEYPQTFQLKIHFHDYINTDQLIYGNNYSINGVAVNFNIVQFYISNIRMVDSAGNETPIAGAYILSTPDDEETDLGNMPVGNYAKVRFDVGIDSVTNHLDPANYQIGDPLGFQSPDMHWSWDYGYKFIKLEGEADTTDDGVTDKYFIIELGFDENLTTIEMEYPLQTIADNTYTYHLTANWYKFFTGLDMTGNLTTHTDKPSLDPQYFNNLTTMFSIEE